MTIWGMYIYCCDYRNVYNVCVCVCVCACACACVLLAWTVAVSCLAYLVGVTVFRGCALHNISKKTLSYYMYLTICICYVAVLCVTL